MKITGFNTSILTSKPDEMIRLFEALGFERSHRDNAESGIVSGSVRMKYADDIEETYSLLSNMAFTMLWAVV